MVGQINSMIELSGVLSAELKGVLYTCVAIVGILGALILVGGFLYRKLKTSACSNACLSAGPDSPTRSTRVYKD